MRVPVRALLLLAIVHFYGLSASAQTTRPGTIIDFEDKLYRMRSEHYRFPKIDSIATGFRPIGGNVADFAVAQHDGRWHFFYIERRLQEGTPFYPGHEIFFGHASTPDLVTWEVHEPVMLVRPGTWEEAHVWAPMILPWRGQYVMAYTGVNRHVSQNIGLASSTDMFDWKRWESNPISPCKDRPWAFWRENGISSCRDPHLVEHDGRIYMTFSANTREGATAVGLASTTDFKTWQDHGPILVGPSSGYEPRLQGGHGQGSIESAHLLHKNGKWHLIAKAVIRTSKVRNWIFESDRVDRFDFSAGREFWPGASGVERIKEKGDRWLIASFFGGYIKFGEVDWSQPQPVGRFIKSVDELTAYTR